MSDKKRRTVTLSREADRVLQQEDNVSAVVTDLVEQYAKTGDRGSAGLELQREHKLNELEEAKDTVERLETEIEELTMLIEERKSQESSEWEEAKDALSGIDERRLTTDNPAVQNWSEKLGVAPTELIERIE